MLRSHCFLSNVRRRSVSFRLIGFLMAVAGTAALLPQSVARGDSGAPQPIERQTREYSISIDGTRRGSSKTQFRSSNGVLSLRSESEIRVNFLVYRYHYVSSGTEIWRNGRIAAVENTSDYNGTQYQLKGSSTPRGLQIMTNGTASLVSSDVWDTSYLILPERLARAESSTVVLLDSDRGERKSGKIQYIGEEALNVGEGRTPCIHYRITGDVHVDLWYDASRRLVYEESKESGHKVRFELLSVTAE